MQKHIWISGKVQGVGFRYFTRKQAEVLGVKGWVKNLPDGRVEAVFDGEEAEVQKLLERCKEGPITGYVKDIEVTEPKEKGTFTEFEIRL